MKHLRRLLRIVLLLLHILVGALLTLVMARHPADGLPSTRFAAVKRAWFQALLRILGIRVRVKGTAAEGGILFVANHISWLDIPVIGSVLEASFLSKQEVRQWPVVGWLAARAGTLFIKRGGRNASNAAAEAMTWRLVRDAPVLIFPEGTTSTGESVLRFHPRLFGAATLAERPVQPIALRYPHVEQIHPTAPFVGDDKLLQHVWQLLAEREVEAEIRLLEPIGVEGADRKLIADQARDQIRAVVEGTTLGSTSRESGG